MKEAISKSSVANVISAVIIVGGLVYGFWTQNNDLIVFLTGAGVGYLFGKKAVEGE